MSLALNQRLHGFTVTRVRPVEELGGTLVEMRHDQTGARLFWTDNGETNKLFSIAFKTLPEDDTGVFHILEHSVLCGSDKFPVREPFVELLKSSMNTFLNAMTFPDKTMYPVSSRNEQDFLNLTEVYLDAVFAPRIFTNPSIFHQEGWHVELTDRDAQPSYKGVVFNEMKGAMSGVDEVVQLGLMKLAYPDNCYGFNSGGDPAAIPNLSYEQFIASYQKYYHPSNSLIYLDGTVPLERTLTLLDGYLSRFEAAAPAQEIPLQTPRAAQATNYYEIAAGESPEGKAYLSLGKIAARWDEPVRVAALSVLCNMLAGSNEAPLKRAVLASGLAQDMTMEAADGVLQPGMILQVKNIDASKADEVLQVIRQTARRLADEGLNRAELEASVNRYAFLFKDRQEPQALIRAITLCESALYGGDPLMYMVRDDVCAALRRMLDDGGFDALLRDLLLDEEGLCILHTLPSATYGEELRQAEAARLQAARSAWTDADVDALLALNRTLEKWQQTEDTPEQLATLPMLSLSEVSPEPIKTDTVISVVDGVTVLQHQAPCPGLTHLSLYFDLAGYSLEELSELSLLKKLLGKLPTAQHDAAALQQAVKTYLGRLSFSVEPFGNPDGTCTPRLTAACSLLEENLPHAQALLQEILTSTRFDDADRIREIVLQADEEGKQMGVMAGHMLGISAAMSHASSTGAVQEALSGHSRLTALHQLAGQFDERFPAFSALMASALEHAVCKARLTLSVTGAQPLDAAPFVALWPQGEAACAKMTAVSPLPRKLGIRIPAQIGYACTGLNLNACGLQYGGALSVAAQALDLGYLWNKVRVQGGAYGAGMIVNHNGSLSCYSYRDPTPARTLQIYGGLTDCLREMVASGEALDKYIISTIASTEPLLSPSALGRRADAAYFTGDAWEDRLLRRRQMLRAEPETLLTWCGALDALAQDAPVCVVAHDEALKACEGLTIVDL